MRRPPQEKGGSWVSAAPALADGIVSSSHRCFRGVTGGQVRMVTVAYHVIGDAITPNVLASMIRQSGLPRELFRK